MSITPLFNILFACNFFSFLGAPAIQNPETGGALFFKPIKNNARLLTAP